MGVLRATIPLFAFLVASWVGCHQRVETVRLDLSRFGNFEPTPDYSTGTPLNDAALKARPYLFETLQQLEADSAPLVTDRICSLSDHLLYKARAKKLGKLEPTLIELAWLHGLPAPLLSAKLETYPAHTPPDPVRLAEKLIPIVGPSGWALFCISQAQTAEGGVHLAMVYTRIDLQLAPLSRVWTLGSTVTAQVRRPRGTDQSAELLLSGDDLNVSSFAPRARGLEAKLKIGGGPVLRWLNIALGKGAYQYLSANLPLFVDNAEIPLVAPGAMAAVNDNAQTGTSSVGDQMISILNKARAAHQLRALQKSPALERLASKAALDLRSGRLPWERPRPALDFLAFSVAWGQLDSIEALGARLVTLPFYRRSYLDPRATHVGFSSEASLYALAIARLPELIDMNRAKARLQRALRTKRSALELPFRFDAALTEVVQREAEAICKTKGQVDLRALNQRIRRTKAAARYRGSSLIQMLIIKPDELSRSLPDIVERPDYSVFGAGLCQGDFKRGRRRVAVLLYAVKEKRI